MFWRESTSGSQEVLTSWAAVWASASIMSTKWRVSRPPPSLEGSVPSSWPRGILHNLLFWNQAEPKALSAMKSSELETTWCKTVWKVGSLAQHGKPCYMSAHLSSLVSLSPSSGLGSQSSAEKWMEIQGFSCSLSMTARKEANFCPFFPNFSQWNK